MSLWTSDEIAAATGGVAEGAFAVDGVSFDSREVRTGELFVAMVGAHTDGHRYVEQALAQGVAGVLISAPRPGTPNVRVADTQAALEALGRAARARLAPQARVIGVTGSAGKTGVKEALRLTFEHSGPTHASVKSYNNHTGVPLSLARMPAATRFGVFEMGMNHRGEIAALTAQVRPHVALITTIAPAHIEHFPDGEAGIADAKAEIFGGLEPGGVGVIPFDSPHYVRLRAACDDSGHRSVSFGLGEGAAVRGIDVEEGADGSSFVIVAEGRHHHARLAFPGAHRVQNALGVAAVALAAGVDVAVVVETFATAFTLPGRGQRHTLRVEGGEALLIDESYNANPASMAAALQVLGVTLGARKIAVIGAMRELGPRGPEYHEAIVPMMRHAGVAHAVLVGEETRIVAGKFAASTHVEDARAALDAVRGMLRAGDVLLVKGSNSVGLGALVAALVPTPVGAA